MNDTLKKGILIGAGSGLVLAFFLGLPKILTTIVGAAAGFYVASTGIDKIKSEFKSITN